MDGEEQNPFLSPKRSRNGNPTDRLSQLPEGILVSILSRLTLKEAATTSILSRRWRNLWKLFDGCIQFDRIHTWLDLALGKGKTSLELERQRFVEWVNHVLKSLETQSLESLIVCFDLVSNSKYEIDSWINFAMQKRVKRIELELFGIGDCDESRELYAFPFNLVNMSASFSSLMSLKLCMVDVSGEVIQHLLLVSCPFLEELSIEDSPSLVSLIVSGSSLKLKYLEIACKWYCNLKHLEISAASVVRFKYEGPDISYPFKNVPNLVEASFGGTFCKQIFSNLHLFPCCISQLERLKFIEESGYDNRLLRNFPSNFPTLNNVKHLEVSATAFSPKHCLLPFLSLLKACPLLHTFTLKVRHSEETLPDEGFQDIFEDYTLPSIKVLEVVGFEGKAAEIEFILHLLRNAIMLRKVIIYPWGFSCFLANPSDISRSKTQFYSIAKSRADELQSKIPPGVEYVVV